MERRDGGIASGGLRRLDEASLAGLRKHEEAMKKKGKQRRSQNICNPNFKTNA